MVKINKRGVSPLAATMLLIIFAVVLGVVVMNVGGSYLELDNEGDIEKIDVLDVVDKCIDSQVITQEEGQALIDNIG